MTLGKHLSTLLSGLAFLAAGLTGGAHAGQIRFLTHALGNNTFVDEAQMLRGLPGGGRAAFFVELVRAMMLETGDISLVEEVPFVRGLHLIGKADDFAFFHLIQTEDRLPKYKWVGPIYDNPSYFYEHIARPTGISSVEDARRVAGVCAVRGTYNLRWLERHDFKNIIVANSFNACLRMLDYGRVALVQSTEHPGTLLDQPLAKKILRQTQVSNRSERLAGEFLGQGFIAFSNNVADAEIARWQQALDHLKQSGAFDQLQKKYIVGTASSAIAPCLTAGH